MEKIKALIKKHYELISYVFFGGLTTVCNFLIYTLCAYPLNIDEITSTVIAFVVSVIFAFYTNRKWVFFSKVKGFKSVFLEFTRFFGGRIFSGGLDILFMFIFVTWLGFNDILIKILSNIIVIILNFFFSKIFVFKKK